MLQVSENEIKTRLAFDNPWWERGREFAPDLASFPKRAYFKSFFRLATMREVRRAVVLMGPRRVGKTVILLQTIQALLDTGTEARRVLYVSLDTPTYIGLGLEMLVRLFEQRNRLGPNDDILVVFDEIQYLKDWEVHLKSLVDSYPRAKFIASGSAAAALRLKSNESGAGRFTDFLLPPLLFAEYLAFIGRESDLIQPIERTPTGPEFKIIDVSALNREFLNYINFGGLPESVLSSAVRAEFGKFVGNDIIDKVLLRDLPSLYGIADTRELNRLFASLAYNTGAELSLVDLSNASGVAANTLRRYLEYLEAAFLVHRVYRVDETARRFKRAVTFKVYLNNPSLRAALFGMVGPEDDAAGRLAETAIFGQLVHSDFIADLHYARWKSDEVDMVKLDPGTGKPQLAVEIKWSDRHVDRLDQLRGLIRFARKNALATVYATSRTAARVIDLDELRLCVAPASYWCYYIGKRTIESHIDSGWYPRALPTST